jgi:hypothetical protein
MAKKKTNWILWVGLGLAYWYWWNQKKKAGGSMTAADTTPAGSDARTAAQEAKQIVNDVVDQTTFLPDVQTDRQIYMNDLNECK